MSRLQLEILLSLRLAAHSNTTAADDDNADEHAPDDEHAARLPMVSADAWGFERGDIALFENQLARRLLNKAHLCLLNRTCMSSTFSCIFRKNIREKKS